MRPRFFGKFLKIVERRVRLIMIMGLGYKKKRRFGRQYWLGSLESKSFLKDVKGIYKHDMSIAPQEK